MPTLPLLLALQLLSGPAHGAGHSTDVELFRPTLAAEAPLGVDGVGEAQPRTVRLGTVLQYVREPLVLYEWGERGGSIIDNRMSAHLGVSANIHPKLALRAVMPLVGQWGTEVPVLSAERFGNGDLTAGLGWSFGRVGPLGAGLRADLTLPIGSRDAYLGESRTRLHAGLLASLDVWRMRFLLDFGYTSRGSIDTTPGFLLADEVVLNTGLRVRLAEPVSASVSMLGRAGTESFLEGEAENSLELLAGVHLWPWSDVQLDLGVGKGVGEGYGTSVVRGLVGLTWVHPPPEREVVVEPEPEPEPELPELVVEKIEEPEPEVVEWEEGETARLEEDHIEIRDRIRFELGTARVLPESRPTIQALAGVLGEQWEIGEVLIEGHASEEGDYAFNYDLSILRAAAIYRALVEAGVHPDRLSYRGMGEVEPGEQDIQANRRVEFKVLRWVEPGEVVPAEQVEVVLPWDGRTVVVNWPQPPPAPADQLDPATLDPASFALSEDGLEVATGLVEAVLAEACDEEAEYLIGQAELLLLDEDLPGTALVMARIEEALSCGPVVDPSLLARLWQVQGVLAALGQDEDRALVLFGAARRSDPSLGSAGYGDQVEELYEQAAPEEGEVLPVGGLRVVAPPGWAAAVDGVEVGGATEVTVGPHLVQVGTLPDSVHFARLVEVLPDGELVITVSPGGQRALMSLIEQSPPDGE